MGNFKLSDFLNKKLLYFIGICIATLTAVFVVKDFTIPLTSPNGGDTDFWEYMGYYVYENISFFEAEHFFLPHLNFESNQHLYPFGANHALQGWAFESTLWYAWCYSLFGDWGNWLGYYYVIVSVIPFFGAYYLLENEIGVKKAVTVAIVVSLFNFYALQRFPYHFSHTVHHWLTLNIIADFVLFKRFIDCNSVSLKLILIKVLLLILVLGLEVGYVVGLALSSAVITTSVSFILLVYRKKNLNSLVKHFANIFTQYKSEFFQHKGYISIIGAIVVFGYLYIPLVGQLFLEVKKFPEPFMHGNWWVNPFRLLLPIFKDPLPESYQSVMRDSTEGLLQGTVGWFVLSLAIIGAFKSFKSKNILIYVPILSLAALCVFFHPSLLPTLKIFPWFEYARVPGRSTIIYPTIMALLAIPALEWPKAKLRQGAYVLIILIGCFELIVNYRFQYQNYNYSFDKNFKAYMKVVKESPGEAIFDYPFCIVGGNGVGGKEGFASFYVSASHVSTMQRFHRKKTVGHYYGRLNESQIEKQVALGWKSLLPTKEYNPYVRQKLSSCPTNFQFEQLVKFIKYNDFSGLSIYTELLPNVSCEEKFIEFFGHPTIESEVPGLGRAIYIPKPKEWFSEIDIEAGKEVSFDDSQNR